MLEVRKLSIKKISENRTLISQLSFVLNKNDKFAIIGLEGIGKSTLLKVILNQSKLDYIEISGEVASNQHRLGYLPQSIREDWKNDTVIDFLLKEYPESTIHPEDYQRLALLDKVLNDLGFKKESFNDEKQLSSFSGGELVKLGLVKILLKDPDILLLDEPTNDLDLETILFLEDFILNEERPILFISHDEALLEHTANGIIHLVQVHKQTKAISYFEKCSYLEYKERRNLNLSSQEMIARKQRQVHKKKMDRFRQIYQKVEHLQNQAVRNPTMGRLLKKKMHSLKSTKARYEKEEKQFAPIPEREEEINLFFESGIELPNNKSVLEWIDQSLVIGDRVLSEHINLSVKGPEKIAIIGKNGVGKSTFIRKIHHELMQNNTLKIGYMSQHYDDGLPLESKVLDFILDSQERERESKIRTMLGSLGFTTEETLYTIKQLSGGQKAKLMLLKLVLDRPNVLLLDEPTRNLSPLSIPVIYQLLNDYRGSIICVTHDRNFIESVFEKVYMLTENGMDMI